jgi:hypothetical protein
VKSWPCCHCASGARREVLADQGRVRPGSRVCRYRDALVLIRRADHKTLRPTVDGAQVGRSRARLGAGQAQPGDTGSLMAGCAPRIESGGAGAAGPQRAPRGPALRTSGFGGPLWAGFAGRGAGAPPPATSRHAESRDVPSRRTRSAWPTVKRSSQLLVRAVIPRNQKSRDPMQAGEPATLPAAAHCAGGRTHHRDATPGRNGSRAAGQSQHGRTLQFHPRGRAWRLTSYRQLQPGNTV